MVAAVLHLDVGARMAAEAVDQGVRRLAHRHDVVDRDARAVGEGQAAIGPSVHLLGIADHPIDLGHGSEPIRLDLGGAAGDDQARLRIVALELADGLRGLPHRLGGDGAGVDDHCIRRARLARREPRITSDS